MKLLRRTYKLYFFGVPSGKIRLAVEKLSAGLSSCLLPLHGNFLKKKFLKSFCISCGPFFRSFSVIEQEKFGRPVKTAFSVSVEKFFEKKLFWKTKEIFYHFQTLSRMSTPCLFFGGLVKIAFYVSIGTLWRKKMFFKTYTFPLFLDRKWNFFENSSGKIRQGYQIEICEPKEQLLGQIFFERLFF